MHIAIISINDYPSIYFSRCLYVESCGIELAIKNILTKGLNK